MLKNKNITSAKSIIKARSINGLAKLVNTIERTLQERKNNIEEVIGPFNNSQKNILKIVYSQDKVPREPNFKEWIGKAHDKKTKYRELNITTENAIEYAYYVFRKEGILGILKMAFQNASSSRYHYSIKDFIENPEFATEEDQKKIIDFIYNDLISEGNLGIILEYLKGYVDDIEDLSLQFNINSKTGNNQRVLFKDVRQLSLGQKVVAMLDFILSYGTFIGDKRPLLLDQPEDNLDSQYIYKNLVQQLREIKSSRQIIIATHNATIVTNSMTDQVCVMTSNGEHGWIEKTGYPSEPIIKKHIINYLEGGIDSFKHKQKLYESVLLSSD